MQSQRKAPTGVIFDFDGVIVDSLKAHIKAWELAYERLYGNVLLDTAGLAGRSTLAIAEILSDRAGSPHTKTQLADLKREFLKQSRLAIELLPGVRSAITWLASNKIPHGIASNAPRAFIEATLARVNLSIEYIFGSDDVAKPKPEPDVFLKCARSLNLSVLSHPKIIVFEDSPHGLKAAVRAGMFPIGVSTQNSDDELFAAGALAVCRTIGEAHEKGWLEELPAKPQGV